MSNKKSEFVLKYADGTFHATGMESYTGMDSLICVKEIEHAQRFDGYQYAVNYKNNQAHLRHLQMTIVELRYELVDRGSVPVTVPDWDDFDKDFDAEEFARAQGDRARAAGRRAAESRHRHLGSSENVTTFSAHAIGEPRTPSKATF